MDACGMLKDVRLPMVSARVDRVQTHISFVGPVRCSDKEEKTDVPVNASSKLYKITT